MNPQPAPAPADNTGQSVVFTRTQIPDPALNMDKALTALIPKGWVNKVQVSWCPNPWNPTSLAGQFIDPQTGSTMSFYPKPIYVQGVAEMAARNAQVAGPEAMQLAASGFPNGSSYMGSVCEPVASPEQYLHDVILGQYRPDLQSAQASDPVEGPDAEQIERNVMQGVPGLAVKGIKVRFTYQKNGQQFEEDMYCTLATIQSPAPLNLVNWYVDCYSQRARSGRWQR